MDKQKMKQQRIDYFNKKAVGEFQKYDLWKAMDFERYIKVVTSHDNDLGIEILKYLYLRMINQSPHPDSLKEIRFKLLANSQINQHKFTRVSKL